MIPLQKKYFICTLSALFLCCVSFYTGFGQANGTGNEKSAPSPGAMQTGFYNVTTFSPATFTGQFLNGIQTICGYKINNHLAIGGGAGVERFTSILTYDNFKTNLTLLSVFADIRYTFLDKKVSPVVAVDGGYKFLLNKASTQNRFDTALGNIDGISSRTDYMDNNVFNQGGLFFTVEAGVKAKVFKKVALFLSLDYSLWEITGDYHLSTQTDILGSDGWVLSNPIMTTENSVAYIHVFLVRLGIAF